MRHLLTALVALAAGPAAAGTYLQSTSLECSALEVAVLYGVIDGTQESTASALTDLIGVNSGSACLAELASYGYDEWTDDSDCREAVRLMQYQGARPRSDLTSVDIVVRVLTDSDDNLCDRMADAARNFGDDEDSGSGGDGSGTGTGSDGGMVN